MRDHLEALKKENVVLTTANATLKSEVEDLKKGAAENKVLLSGLVAERDRLKETLDESSVSRHDVSTVP